MRYSKRRYLYATKHNNMTITLNNNRLLTLTTEQVAAITAMPLTNYNHQQVEVHQGTKVYYISRQSKRQYVISTHYRKYNRVAICGSFTMA